MTAPEATPAAPVVKKFELSPRVEALLADKRAQAQMIASISELNWGKGMSYEMRRAMGSYCRRNGLDPREIHILGGNIYRNGKYWLRRLSELVQDNHIEYARIQFINHDPRIEADVATYDALAKDASLSDEERQKYAAHRDLSRAEMMMRRDLRIKHRVPEEAAAAAVAIVKAKWLTEETVGCKFIVMGRKKQTRDGPKIADPVGEEFPTETVETRAWRRCLRIIASTNPALKAVEEELKDDELSVTASLQEIAQREVAQEEVSEGMSPRQLNGPMVTEVVVDRAAEIVTLSDGPDPYADEPRPASRPLGAAPVSPRDG